MKQQLCKGSCAGAPAAGSTAPSGAVHRSAARQAPLFFFVLGSLGLFLAAEGKAKDIAAAGYGLHTYLVRYLYLDALGYHHSAGAPAGLALAGDAGLPETVDVNFADKGFGENLNRQAYLRHLKAGVAALVGRAGGRRRGRGREFIAQNIHCYNILCGLSFSLYFSRRPAKSAATAGHERRRPVCGMRGSSLRRIRRFTSMGDFW